MGAFRRRRARVRHARRACRMNDIAPRRSSRNEPTSVLIAALGGQGGGVLTEWIVHAARSEGLVAQATSTPGVSQRTGATSYYVEIAAPPRLGAAPPVLGLAPLPGRVDVLVCAELLEAARTVVSRPSASSTPCVRCRGAQRCSTWKRFARATAASSARRCSGHWRPAVRCRYRGKHAPARFALRARACGRAWPRSTTRSR